MDLSPFTYELGVLPHAGSWQESSIVPAAYNFNFPLVVGDISTAKQGNVKSAKIGDDITLPLESMQISLVQVDAPNIIIGAVKRSDWCGRDARELVSDQEWAWNHAIILRLVEQHGTQTRATLTFHPDLRITRVEEFNLLEMHPTTEILVYEGQASTSFSPFEIKTLRIWLECKVDL